MGQAHDSGAEAVSDRPARTKERKRELERQKAERAELDAVRAEGERCAACDIGIHDPAYDDDGICRCRCCNRDMTDEGFPWVSDQ